MASSAGLQQVRVACRLRPPKSQLKSPSACYIKEKSADKIVVTWVSPLHKFRLIKPKSRKKRGKRQNSPLIAYLAKIQASRTYTNMQLNLCWSVWLCNVRCIKWGKRCYFRLWPNSHRQNAHNLSRTRFINRATQDKQIRVFYRASLMASSKRLTPSKGESTNSPVVVLNCINTTSMTCSDSARCSTFMSMKMTTNLLYVKLPSYNWQIQTT